MRIRAPLKSNCQTRQGFVLKSKSQGREGGTLMIKYKTLEQLDDVTHRLAKAALSG